MLKKFKLLFISIGVVMMNVSTCFGIVAKEIERPSTLEKILDFLAPWIATACFLGIAFIFYKIIPKLIKLSLKMSELRKQKGERNIELENELQAECDRIRRICVPVISVLLLIGTLSLIFSV